MSGTDLGRMRIAIPVVAMTAVVIASNILVQYPFRPFGLEEYLTWGAFTYPVAFLITDLTVRLFGPISARRVVLVGFVFAVLLSIWLATPRIALASGLAFLTAQLIDVALFRRLVRFRWWLPPFVSSLLSSAIDTAIFFTVAFSCEPMVAGFIGLFGISEPCMPGFPWHTLAVCDYLVKVALAMLSVAPYGAILAWLRPDMLRSGAVGPR